MSKPDLTLHQKSADPVESLEHVQAALDRVTAEANHSERLATLGMLAAGVAHEISNILTPVLAYAQMALSKQGDQTLLIRAAEKTVLGVETATRIADAMLGFAGHSDAVDADVAEVVKASLNCLGRDPNKDQIDVRIEVQPGTVVHINPLNLQQVLMNLILNAKAAMTKASESQPRGITAGRLTIAAITRADGTIGIRVTDTGPGISPEVAGRIFEPFVTTRQSADGSTRTGGLGLAICRRLIEQASGTITASSTPGRGTTFLVILPSPKSNRAKAG